MRARRFEITTVAPMSFSSTDSSQSSMMMSFPRPFGPRARSLSLGSGGRPTASFSGANSRAGLKQVNRTYSGYSAQLYAPLLDLPSEKAIRDSPQQQPTGNGNTDLVGNISAAQIVPPDGLTPLQKSARLGFLSLHLLCFSLVCCRHIFVGIFPQVCKAQGISGTSVGVIFAAYPFGMSITSILSPLLIVRWGARIQSCLGSSSVL